MHHSFCFLTRTRYILSERLFRLVSETSGSSRWKYQDPPLLIFHPEHHVIIFSSRNFLGYHISRIISLQAYYGTKSVGLQDWDIALFILHLLRCWYGDLVSHHALEHRVLFLFFSLFMIFASGVVKSSIDSASYIYDMFK